MSRIGRKPIEIPVGVTLTNENNLITVKGPKGTLSERIHGDITVEVEGSIVNVTRPTDEKEHRSLHGLSRTLVANMVEGVTKGFSKTLEVNGVGYRVQKTGKDLVLNIGYSHPVVISETEDISIDVQGTNKVVISGPNKQKVGQFAAEVRKKRLPEPYKGKGIKYDYEVIRRKEGKTGKKK